jgi:hypothetical protein
MDLVVKNANRTIPLWNHFLVNRWILAVDEVEQARIKTTPLVLDAGNFQVTLAPRTTRLTLRIEARLVLGTSNHLLLAIQQRWRFEIDPVLDAMGNPVPNAAGLPAAGRNRGCGNVWSSATIDADHGIVAFGTADCDYGADPPYHSGVLALDARSGRLRWAFTPHATDQTLCDVDFGATANRIRLDQRTYFGVGGKDGTYYMLDATTSDRHGRALWSTNVVFGGSAGGFFGGAAYDGKRSYSATGYGDFFNCDPTNPRDLPFQEPSIHAFDVRTGHVAWEQQLAQSFAATTAGDGVVLTTFPGTPEGGSPSAARLRRR